MITKKYYILLGLGVFASMLFVGLLVFPKAIASNDQTIFPLESHHDAQVFEVLEDVGIEEARGFADDLPLGLWRELVDWQAYREDIDGVGFYEMRDFLKSHPDLPQRRTISRNAERRLLELVAEGENVPSRTEILAWFADYPPFLFEAMLLYGSILEDENYLTRRQWAARDYWLQRRPTREEEKRFIAIFGEALRDIDNHNRFEQSFNNGWYSRAGRMRSLLPENEREIAVARIALARRQSWAAGLLEDIPQNLRNSSEALAFEEARHERRHSSDDSAAEMLAAQSENSPIAMRWWEERQILSRRALADGREEDAYEIALHHDLPEGITRVTAEWYLGWLALRYLDNPMLAYQHFEPLYEEVDTPISYGRTAYWTGRALAVLEERGITPENALASDDWYRLAAENRGVYYGQLAAEELGISLENRGFDITEEDMRLRRDGELFQAVLIFDMLGMEAEELIFLNHLEDLAKNSDNPALEMLDVADLAEEVGQTHEMLDAAKWAQRHGMEDIQHLYPILPYALRENIEIDAGLLHGIIRQESMFNDGAISPAGARGLMQLMPATAREIGGDLGLRNITRGNLISDAALNIRLGSHYLATQLEDFDGSEILAIAAYNAGPRRVRQWIEQYGNPRYLNSHYDVIDWVETIPYSETRNYVQRVMEATAIYRQQADFERLEMVRNNNE